MDFSELLLPEVIFKYFKCVHCEIQATQIDIYLEEKMERPQKSGSIYTSQGYTSERVIQDFPIRGKAVYLHIKRRKWLEEPSGAIITSKYDLAHIGTQISEEFASFLKGIH